VSEVLERRFAAIGARAKVERVRTEPRIDVAVDRRGAFFALRLPRDRESASIIDVDRDDHSLLLLVRDGDVKSKFLCGLDERHWFVAAIPEWARGVGTVENAKDALQPGPVRDAVARVRPRDRFRRRNVAYVRQGEWFFLPRWSVSKEVDWRDVLYDEPLTRGRGKAHVLQWAFRRGGERVYVNDAHPTGISAERWAALSQRQRFEGGWRRSVRGPELYAKGVVTHPDHRFIVLHCWHRVLMNTEHGARAMRHVAFID
jgi:hypothetical protein